MSDDPDFGKTFDFSEEPAAPVPPPSGSNAGLLIGGIALLGGVLLALVGVGALGIGLFFGTRDVSTEVAGVEAPAPHPSGCPVGQEGSIGWIRAESMKIRKGNVHTLSRPTPLLTRAGGSTSVCTLPPGTSIYAVRSTKTNVKGAWLQVYGTAVTLPD